MVILVGLLINESRYCLEWGYSCSRYIHLDIIYTLTPYWPYTSFWGHDFKIHFDTIFTIYRLAHHIDHTLHFHVMISKYTLTPYSPYIHLNTIYTKISLPHYHELLLQRILNIQHVPKWEYTICNGWLPRIMISIQSDIIPNQLLETEAVSVEV